MTTRNKWILIRNAFKYPELKNSINDRKMDAVVGFMYVDDQCGLSLQIDGYFTDRAYIKITDTLLVFRHSAFSSFILEDLSIFQQEIINLPDIPEWLSIYEDEELKKVRDDNTLDQFRHPIFLDDVRGGLILKNKSLELVWFRVEKKLSDGYKVTLLNTPTTGTVKKGDNLILRHSKIRDVNFLVAIEE